MGQIWKQPAPQLGWVLPTSNRKKAIARHTLRQKPPRARTTHSLKLLLATTNRGRPCVAFLERCTYMSAAAEIQLSAKSVECARAQQSQESAISAGMDRLNESLHN